MQPIELPQDMDMSNFGVEDTNESPLQLPNQPSVEAPPQPLNSNAVILCETRSGHVVCDMA